MRVLGLEELKYSRWSSIRTRRVIFTHMLGWFDRVQAGGPAVIRQADRNESWNQHMKEQNEKFRPFLTGHGKITDFNSRQWHRQIFTSKKSKIILKFLAQVTLEDANVSKNTRVENLRKKMSFPSESNKCDRKNDAGIQRTSSYEWQSRRDWQGGRGH